MYPAYSGIINAMRTFKKNSPEWRFRGTRLILVLVVISCAPMNFPPSNGSQKGLLESPSTYTLHGTFTAPQHQDGSRPVQAVFTSTGREQDWKVAFHFKFNGGQRIYRGSAEGGLNEGLLRGTVRGSGNRVFTFSVYNKQGVFKGTHAEITHNIPNNTGTLTLQAEPVTAR